MRNTVSKMGVVYKYALGTFLLFAFSNSAAAGPILGATSAAINIGGPGAYSISDTFNQNGLTSGYTSGVTDFDTYIGSNPQHEIVGSGNEWFSNDGSLSASVTYDLGSTYRIDAFALWNEEFSGIGNFALSSSQDGSTFTNLLSGVSPINNPPSATYGPETFNFGETNARFFQLDMSGCPFPACSIGEVAFRVADASEATIPLPSTFGLFLVGLAAMGLYRRRYQKST